MKKIKKGLKISTSILLTTTLIFSALLFGGCSKSDNERGGSDADNYTWWITKTDSNGTYYNDYEESVVIQWLNNQYWDKENLTLGTEDKGTKLNLSFQVPIMGAEKDNFNTMIATGEYPEIINLSLSNESPYQLYQDGVLMDITEYVENYLPNYVALLDEHPEIKPLVTYTDEAGELHYYSLYAVADNVITPWEGYQYRRDWVVKYADPTPYVWDLDSDYVKQNEHPLYTPLSAAEAANDFTGWKVNDVTEFTSSEGDDPLNDYADNVIFPSGSSDPLTISDWEWMFEAFAKAIEAEGFNDDTNAYCTSIPFSGTSDMVSSFGGGGSSWYKNKSNIIEFGGVSDSFKTYLTAMNNWYNNDWVDTKFETRASDAFYNINSTGIGQGMVGLWQGGQAYLGTTIRATAVDPNAQKDAMVLGCAIPINDVYGSDNDKFVTPYTFYQQGMLGAATGFTKACEGKDLETLFAAINWMYSKEGGLTVGVGLSKDQYSSMKFNPDSYADNNVDCSYSTVQNDDGTITYESSVPFDTRLHTALTGQRLGTYLQIEGNIDLGYTLGKGFSNNVTNAITQWTKYTDSGFLYSYTPLMDDTQSATYSKIFTYVTDYMNQALPQMIKQGVGSWDDYVKKLEKYGPTKVTDIYQDIMDDIFK